MAARHVVIGTAGHIDHGKSALVSALTGTDPDRLPEEQERGITIDLGFAHLETDEGVTFSFVDVPGHERFVKNMLAGAGGVDLVLLVVAADESVMPQTREHFHICRMLGAERGVIALTKCDLVDEEMVSIVSLEVEELVAGSFLEGAPIVPVSSTQRTGLEELTAALLSLSETTPPRNLDGPFRIPVDRVFTIKGFGTVVTGTSLSGRVRDGDTLAVLPRGGTVKVRGIQVHGGSADEAIAGQRVALNLQNVSRYEIARGDWLTEPARFTPTPWIDTRLDLLPTAPAPLEDMARVRFHIGAREALARIRVLEPEGRIAPGGTGLAQVRLESPIHILHDERFVLRRYSPITTVGGGVVLDPCPPKRSRHDPEATSHFAELESGDAERILAAWIGAAGEDGLTDEDLASRTDWTDNRIRKTVRSLLDHGTIVRTGSALLARDLRDELLARMGGLLEAFHEEQPLVPGMGAPELRSALGVSEAVFQGLLEHAIKSGAAGREGEHVFSSSHRVVLSPEEEQTQLSIETAFRDGGLTPPDEKTVLEQHAGKRTREVYQILLDQGVLRRLKGGYVFHRDALEALEEQVREGPESFKVTEFKERTGTTRKHAIPLLEYLDGRNVTLRTGDVRRVLGRSPA